jgi:hypothetical protein
MPGLARRAATSCRNHDGGKAGLLGAKSADYPKPIKPVHLLPTSSVVFGHPRATAFSERG